MILFGHEVCRTYLILAPGYDLPSLAHHSFAGDFFHRKDWPQRRVVSIQSSVRLTGSLRHSETRTFAIGNVQLKSGEVDVQLLLYASSVRCSSADFAKADFATGLLPIFNATEENQRTGTTTCRITSSKSIIDSS